MQVLAILGVMAAFSAGNDAGVQADPTMVQAMASRIAPNGYTVVQVVALSEASGQQWGILAATVGPAPIPNTKSYTQVRAGVGKVVNDELQMVMSWKVVQDPRPGMGPQNDIEAFASDLNGDGNDDLSIQGSMQGASWMPSFVSMYTVYNGAWTTAGSAVSDFPLTQAKVGTSNRSAWLGTTSIGANLAHFQQPEWPDYWFIQNGKVTNANKSFASQYSAWPSKIQALLANDPTDYDLLYHLGLSYQTLGNSTQAKASYIKALTAANAAIKQAGGNTDLIAMIQASIKQINASLATL